MRQDDQLLLTRLQDQVDTMQGKVDTIKDGIQSQVDSIKDAIPAKISDLVNKGLAEKLPADTSKQVGEIESNIKQLHTLVKQI